VFYNTSCFALAVYRKFYLALSRSANVKIDPSLFSQRTGQKNSLAHCLRGTRESRAARVLLVMNKKRAKLLRLSYE